MKTYAICCTSRSGSTYLCQLLESAGIGRPDEYFNPTGKPRGEPYWRAVVDAAPGCGRVDYLTQLFDKRTQGGFFGVKVSTVGAMRFILDREPKAKIIYLTRRDTLRQAISLYRAEKSNQWESGEPGGCDVPFDGAAIIRCRKRIESANNRWRQYLSGKNFMPIEYERLRPYPQTTILAIANWLGADLDAIPEASATCKIQSDQTTEAWLEKLR